MLVTEIVDVWGRTWGGAAREELIIRVNSIKQLSNVLMALAVIAFIGTYPSHLTSRTSDKGTN